MNRSVLRTVFFPVKITEDCEGKEPYFEKITRGIDIIKNDGQTMFNYSILFYIE